MEAGDPQREALDAGKEVVRELESRLQVRCASSTAEESQSASLTSYQESSLLLLAGPS